MEQTQPRKEVGVKHASSRWPDENFSNTKSLEPDICYDDAHDRKLATGKMTGSEKSKER